MKHALTAFLVLCLVVLGCSSRSLVGLRSDLVVTSVIERGPYLDVVVQDDDIAVRVFIDKSDAECVAVMAVDQPVDYANRGLAGRFKGEPGVCNPVGIGDPFIRRLSQPDRIDRSIIPRGQATYQRIWEDDTHALLRGRFPLVGKVGWVGGEDTVAVVQTNDGCRRAIDSGVASIEFRARGINTLALVSGSGLCRIEGLIRPL